MRGVPSSTRPITAKIIIDPSVAAGRNSNSPVKKTTTIASTADDAIPASWVRAPASPFTTVRLKAPACGCALKKAPRVFAAPRPRSSWFGSRGVPKRSAMACATLIASMKPMSADTSADGHMRPASSAKSGPNGSRGAGSPEAIFPTTPTPSWSRRRLPTTTMLTTTTRRAEGKALMACCSAGLSDTAGIERANFLAQLSAKKSSSDSAVRASVTRWTLPSAMPTTASAHVCHAYARRGIRKPKTAGSWLVPMMNAAAAVKPFSTG
mmetsp:Transcript_20166/g.77385  ORF Transcript_20166/g.77385 Transcript_20166/m.77385 type:complete len:266 (+) Transcript_20166:2146-2943(+)